MCLVGTDYVNTKNESDSPSVRPTKRKEPIKVDISVKVVPKPRKVNSIIINFNWLSIFSSPNKKQTETISFRLEKISF